MKRWFIVGWICLAACSADSKDSVEIEDVGGCEEPDECPEGTSYCDDEGEDCVWLNGPCSGVSCRDDVAACNNTFSVGCPDGAFEMDCTPGEGTCFENAEGVGGCAIEATCLCNECPPETFIVDNCTGVDGCTDVTSCDEQLSCASCPEASCGEGEVRTSRCADGVPCRSELCPSNDRITFSCRAEEQCPEVVECPLNTTPCQMPSDTCLQYKSCATVLLCEAT